MYRVLVLVLLLVLVACGSPATSDIPPTIEVQGASATLKTVQLNMKVTVKNTRLGISTSTPTGLRASYLYSGTGGVNRQPDKLRTDIPGAMYKDGRARTLVERGDVYALGANKTGGSISSAGTGSDTTVYFSDSMNVDTALTEALASSGTGSMTSLNMNLSGDPFGTVSPTVFKDNALAEGYTVSNSAGTVTATRTAPQNGGAWRQILYYDADVGAVSRIEVTAEGESGSEKTTTDIKYVDASGIPGMAMPYQINSTTTTQLPPESDIIFGRSMTSQQTITFSDIKINTLSSADFPGGN